MADVRMKGFAERADVEVVERFLADRAGVLGAEKVPVIECIGRVLAEDVTAAVDVPGFRRSAMDGYAVRGEDTFGASDYDPISLELVGLSLPGNPFDGSVEPRQAVRIMTGAPVPDGADAVVMAEVCEELATTVRVRDAVAPQKNLGAIGEDVRAGDLLLRSGRVLRPQDAGVLVAASFCPVCRHPPNSTVIRSGTSMSGTAGLVSASIHNLAWPRPRGGRSRTFEGDARNVRIASPMARTPRSIEPPPRK